MDSQVKCSTDIYITGKRHLVTSLCFIIFSVLIAVLTLQHFALWAIPLSVVSRELWEVCIKGFKKNQSESP